MKLLNICLFFAVGGLLLSSSAHAVALDPTRLGMGARMIALGRTAAADPGNINSLFVNPANAAYLTEFGATSMFASLAEDINYTMLGAAKPLPQGTLGVAYLGASSPGFLQTTYEAGRVIGTGNAFDYSSSVINFAWGKELREKLALGVALKLFNKGFSGVAGGTGSGYDLDLGLLWRPRPQLAAGLAVKNILPDNINWGTNTKEDLPSAFKAGLNFQARDNLLIAADLDVGGGDPFTLHGGVEWLPKPWLAVRGGIDQLAASATASNTNLTAGLGFLFKGFSFDYAYYNDAVLSANTAHYFSFSYLLPGKIKPAEVVAPAPVPASPSQVIPLPAQTILPLPKAPVVKKKPAPKKPAAKPLPPRAKKSR